MLVRVRAVEIVRAERRQLDAQLFVAAYLECGGSAAAAWRKLHRDCSVKSSWSNGYRWLQRPEVQAELRLQLERLRDRRGLSPVVRD